jgi:hypothetical protein
VSEQTAQSSARGKTVIISFEATDANLYLYPDEQPRLSYRVQLARIRPHRASRESIQLSTEEKFEDVNSYINVFTETAELKSKDDRKCIGHITYVPAFDDRYGPDSTPACCDARLFVPKITFDELLATARLGRLPSSIWIEVEGMEYDWQPDGSGKKWDNKAFPELNIISINFSLPLIAQVTNNNIDQHPFDQVLPPTRSQFNDLSEKLDRIAIETRRGLRTLIWVVLLVGAIFLFLR